MATVNEVVRSGQVSRDVRLVFQWCLRQGADPRRTAAAARGYSGGWGNGTEEFPHVPRVAHVGRSAITLVLGLISVLEKISIYEHKGKYQDQLHAAKQLLTVFAQFRVGVPTTPVASAAVEMWDSIREDQEQTDIELCVTGAPEEEWCSGGWSRHSEAEQGVVRAHALVLCHASPVLKASLSCDMLECKTRVVQVPGASVEAVQLLLGILYSGTLPSSPASGRKRHSGAWCVGEAVDANWRGRGRWWPAHIVAAHEDGSFDVAYDGRGNFFQPRMQRSQLRAPRDGGSGGYHGHTTAADRMRTRILALDVAHRWQADHAVALLEHALAEQLRDGPHRAAWFAHGGDCEEDTEVFEMLCEAAVLKDLPLLRAACKQFAAASAEVRLCYETGSLSATAMRELSGVFE